MNCKDCDLKAYDGMHPTIAAAIHAAFSKLDGTARNIPHTTPPQAYRLPKGDQ